MTATQRRIKRWTIKLYRWLQNNTIKALAGAPLIIGGAILLSYALSIREFPEFSLTDLTGTLLAIFVIGLLVFIAFGIYCLLPGLAARFVLDSFYPEAREPHANIDANQPSTPTPRERLSRGKFLLYATLVALQTLLTLGFCQWSDGQFAPPHNTEFTYALWASWIAIVFLMIIDWQPPLSNGRRVTHHTLLAMWIGSVLVITILFTAASADPDQLWLPLPLPESQTLPAQGVSWRDIATTALPHLKWISASIVLLPMSYLLVAAVFRKLATYLKNRAHTQRSKTDESVRPKQTPCKLFLAKLCITAALTVGFFISLLVVILLVDIRPASTWLSSILILLPLQVVLNWIAFSLRSLVQRMFLVLGAAAIFLVFVPVVFNNPSYFPKAIIATLGLGDIHLQSISLAGDQCATLAPYGVSCSYSADQNLTLTNVNLLNKVGASTVLELMIQPDTTPLTSPSFSGLGTFTTLRMLVPNPPLQQGAKLRDCDATLLEQSSNSHTNPLLCIQLILPKEQVLGYVTTGRRNYNAGYSAFMSPTKTDPLP
ncbi:hypothetical protein ACLO87_01685 [Paenalcaligenes sp. Me52]|uniref:hypothetical protein n=1 Tax=Paenalcaligenes sp. Me52 TaxID=3392038 RepID=UPI003D2D077A